MKERMTVTQKTPHKTKIAASLSVILGAGLAAPIYAQESAESTDNIEVIQVSGIRSSVQESMGIKRDSAGVVDAISAEDIGKLAKLYLEECNTTKEIKFKLDAIFSNKESLENFEEEFKIVKECTKIFGSL